MDKNTKDWVNSKVEVRNSPFEGKGMFAKETIREGEKVIVWRGQYVNTTKAEQARLDGKLVMQWDDDLFSIEKRGDDQGYFINHSCDSNLWMQDAYALIAKRKIPVNEEITADYALWEADENYISGWNCKCGSEKCRGKVTGKDWQTFEVQEKYLNHFSPLINRRIKDRS